MKKSLPLFIFLPFLFLFESMLGQQHNYPEAYRAFDATISRENTNLLAGIEYIEQHPVINDKHKFYETTEFRSGQVTYRGETYDKVDLRYNIFDDVLIARIPKRKGQATFQLFTNRVQGFKINETQFVNIPEKDSGKQAITGFFEILDSSEVFSLYKKHRKKSQKQLDRDFVYFEFEPDDPEYAIKYEGKYFSMNREKDWKEVFPEQKQVISEFFNREKNLQREKPDAFMTKLANEIQKNLASGL